MRTQDPPSTHLGRRGFLLALASPVAIAALPGRAAARREDSPASSSPDADAPHDPALLHPPIAALRQIRLPIGLSPAVVYHALPVAPIPGKGG